MTSPHVRLAALADELERTLRGIDAWSDPAPALLPFRLPFAMDAMPLEHWLQLVLVPRLRAIATAGEAIPSRSNLAAHAVREFDGRDDRDALVDVLRRIDELSPAEPSPASRAPRVDGRRLARNGGRRFARDDGQSFARNGGRRFALALTLIMLVSAWAFVALWLGTRLAPALPFVSQRRVIQSFTGSAAPGADYQPIRITVTALADDDHTIRATDASFVLLRSMRTVERGPTAPLDFPMNERPTAAATLDWLADFGVDEHAAAAHAAAAEALALAAAAAKARTTDALHAAAADVGPRVRSDELLRVGAGTPGWVALALVPILVLSGAVPIVAGVLRLARSS